MHRLFTISFLIILAGCQTTSRHAMDEMTDKEYREILLSVYKDQPADTLTPTVTHPNKLDILALAEQQQFDQLESYFTQLYAAVNAKQVNEDWLRQAHHAFYNSDPALQQYLDSWITSYPNSYFAFLSRGIYWMRHAELSRGGDYSNNTQTRQKLGMDHYQQIALADIHKAAELDTNAFLPYSYMMSIGRSRRDKDAYLTARSEGLARYPESFILRNEILFSLQPKWGGTEGELDLFLDETSRYAKVNPELQSLLGYKDLIKGDVMKNDDRQAAIAFYDAAIEWGGNDYMYFSRGKNHYYKGDYQQALSDFNRALTFYPQHYLSLRYKAWALYKLKKYKQAITIFELALQIDKLAPGANYGLAYTLSSQGRHQEAVKYYEASVKHYGAYKAKTLSNYGRMLLWNLKDYERAAEILKRATEVNSKSPSAWYNYGIALNHLRDCDVISIHKTYLQLCKGNKRCSKKNNEWVNQNSAALIGNGTCKDQPMFLY